MRHRLFLFLFASLMVGLTLGCSVGEMIIRPATATPVPSRTPRPTFTVVPTATDTPVPTSTPIPTATPTFRPTYRDGHLPPTYASTSATRAT